jgi:hypothetical protein
MRRGKGTGCGDRWKLGRQEEQEARYGEGKGVQDKKTPTRQEDKQDNIMNNKMNKTSPTKDG